jgi:hypothetical protein
LASTIHAQSLEGGCPHMPADTGLTWEHRGTGDADFCRALRDDGSEAFGMYISPKPAFEPKRGNRAEESLIDGRTITWYRSELAGQPDVLARETLVELDNGRTAHIWVQADSEAALREAYQKTTGLRFSPERLSSN